MGAWQLNANDHAPTWIMLDLLDQNCVNRKFTKDEPLAIPSKVVTVETRLFPTPRIS
jgi:hypothetical protein